MPSPEIPPEVFYAAVIESPNMSRQYRYFIFELTVSDFSGNSTAVLCEWFADKSRFNHKQYAVASKETFKELITKQLYKEELGQII
jgi:hypothetical protein